MGADLYNERYFKRTPELVATDARKRELQARLDKIRLDGNGLRDYLKGPDPADQLREEYTAAYDKMYSDPLYYFRDSYNSSSVLWKMGLSWWTDVIPLQIKHTDEEYAIFEVTDDYPDINLDAAGCQTLIDMIHAATYDFRVEMDSVSDEEREYYESKRERLIAFLEQGILDGGISASL